MTGQQKRNMMMQSKIYVDIQTLQSAPEYPSLQTQVLATHRPCRRLLEHPKGQLAEILIKQKKEHETYLLAMKLREILIYTSKSSTLLHLTHV